MIGPSIKPTCECEIVFKMASRDRPVEGFYSALNAVSSADADIMEPKNKRVNRRRTAGTYWEVERLVERRERSGAVSVFACVCTC